MISGNDGVLTKVTDAKKANERGVYEDRVRLAVQAALIDGEGTINIDDTEGNAKGSLKKALLNEFGEDVANAYTGNGIVKLKSGKYLVG